MAGAAPFFFDQPGGLEHLQVLRHSGTAYGKTVGEFADRRGPAPQQVDHTLASGIGECAQHLPSVGHTLP